jgi:hypothetical protein
MATYVVQIKERWDFEVEADSEAEAKAEAEELRSFGLKVWDNPGDPKLYDLGIKVTRKAA